MEKLKYKYTPYMRDIHDMDYVGASYNLIGEANKKLTSIFLTDELKQLINDAIDGKPYPSFYLAFGNINEDKITIEARSMDSLVMNEPQESRFKDFSKTFNTIVDKYFTEVKKMPTNVPNGFIEKLISDYPYMGKYFERIED